MLHSLLLCKEVHEQFESMNLLLVDSSEVRVTIVGFVDRLKGELA